MNALQFLMFFLYNILFPGIVWLLFFVAMYRPDGMQNYVHEAVFLLAMRFVWSVAVGIKYGFYSKALVFLLQKQPIPPVFIFAEQIMMSWKLPLDRLMFELRVASLGLPISLSEAVIPLPQAHPLAKYCQKCHDVGDLPLCLLQPSVLSRLLQILPATNFHAAFWSKPEPVIKPQNKLNKSPRTQANSLPIQEESYSRYLATDDLNMSSSDAFAPTESSAATEAASAKLRHRRSTLFSAHRPFVASFDSTVDAAQAKGTLRIPSDHVAVPAGLILAYCVVRSWNCGQWFIGSSIDDFRFPAPIILLTLSLATYLIPGIMRILEVHLCDPSLSFTFFF
jgi:hypothetical protein